MVKSTLIARVADGLLLAASMDDDETPDIKEYKNQTKLIFKRLNTEQDQRCTIESGPYCFHYLIEYGVCYLVICDKSYPKKLAFAYLEELQKEFHEKYGNEVSRVDRPYALVKFDTFIQKVKRQYKDTRAQRNLHKLNEDLHDVTRIMTKNIESVLGRGENLEQMSQTSYKLSSESKKYKAAAHKLNLMALYQKYGPLVIVFLVVLFIIYFRWF